MVLANQAAYAQSGHYNGPRVLTPGAIGQFEFEGSDSMYSNGAYCSQCHTDQGFVSWVTTGTAGNQEPASPPGCFTCHSPHETGNFSLRKQTPVTLIDGTTYDHGAGNLCVNCHHARTAATAGASPFLTGYATTAQSPTVPVLQWSSSSGPHHGVQSDVGLGRDFFAEGANTYVGTSPHFTATVDSCVSCHKFDPATGNLSGSLQLGGHGFYLTADVHGAQTDVVALCKTCHITVGTTFPTTHLAPADWDGKNGTQDKLLEIKGLRNTLLGYFATSANFPAATPTPVVTPSGGPFTVDPTLVHNEWNQDWVFNPSSTKLQLDASQSEAFWNLKLFIEDRSGGIHNPTFAAQILYDSIDILNNDVNYPVTLTKGTRPQ
jgi:hypothetical protein